MIGRIVMACVVMIGTVVLVWWAWRDLMRALGHAPVVRLRPGGDRVITLPVLPVSKTHRIVRRRARRGRWYDLGSVELPPGEHEVKVTPTEIVVTTHPFREDPGVIQ